MSQLEVRVNGRPIKTYFHEGKTYVEGRKGSEYTLHVNNNSYSRKKFVVSVDGLNVISGDTNWERGYVLDPWQSVDIPGWRKDSDTVNPFFFSGIKGSYNQQNDSGEKKNIGVIGCMVFSEKPSYTYVPIQSQYTYGGGTIFNNATCSWQCGGGNGGGGSSDWLEQSSFTASATATPAGMATAAMNVQNSTSFLRSAESVKNRERSKTVKQSIGTGFSDKEVEFKTHTVYYDFYKDACATLLIHYDDWHGLKNRGIIQGRKRVEKQPNAFPGYNPDGCPRPRRRH